MISEYWKFGRPGWRETHLNISVKHTEVTHTQCVYWLQANIPFGVGHSSGGGAQTEVHAAHRKEVFANWGHLSLSRNQGHLLPRSLNSHFNTQTQHLTTTSGLSKNTSLLYNIALSSSIKKEVHTSRQKASEYFDEGIILENAPPACPHASKGTEVQDVINLWCYTDFSNTVSLCCTKHSFQEQG